MHDRAGRKNRSRARRVIGTWTVPIRSPATIRGCPFSPRPNPPPERSRVAKFGLFGGGISSRAARGERRRPGAPTKETEPKKKKTPPVSVILRDALDLLRARRGRLALGFGLLVLSRLAGLVLPGTTKFLIDEVINKRRHQLLLPLVALAAAATLIQAITGFALSQVLGKAAQRSITEMRRSVQRHV